jgi:hypothetical protein
MRSVPGIASSLRLGALALAALVALAAGCSALLDWNGYSGGQAKGDDAGAGSDAGDAREAGATEAGGGGVEGGEDGGDGGDGGDGSDGNVPDTGVFDGGIPTCGPDSGCGGCCNVNGLCVGGRSTDTCGVNGATCVDCQSGGNVCSDGVCVPPSEDAAPPPACTLARCLSFDAGVPCVPVYQTSCCKSDGTCGCVVEFPPGTCM